MILKRNELVSELGLIPGSILTSDLHVNSIACALDVVLGYAGNINELVLEEGTGKRLRELKCN